MHEKAIVLKKIKTLESIDPSQNDYVKLSNWVNKLLTVPAGDNVIRLAPPLIINKMHVDQAIKILDQTFKTL